MTWFKKFFRRNARQRQLFLEALYWLLWARLVVLIVPFRRIAPRLGRSAAETGRSIAPADRALAVDVSWAVQTAARYVPFGFVCLPQAMAAQRMLRRRGLASTLYLGVAADQKSPTAIAAHAWLRAGDKTLTGEQEAARHQMLVSFADEPQEG